MDTLERRLIEAVAQHIRDVLDDESGKLERPSELALEASHEMLGVLLAVSKPGAEQVPTIPTFGANGGKVPTRVIPHLGEIS